MAKKFDYFKCFIDMAEIAHKEATLLKDIVSDYNTETIHDKITNMHNLERDADDHRHELLDKLLHEFLPPFDHEDITALIERLDDVCDCIDDVTMRFYMYDIHSMRNDIGKICEGIIGCTGELLESVKNFENYKRDSKDLLEQINDVNMIEETGDNYYMESTHQLFVENDIKEIIRWKSLYACLEDCYDACEAVTEQMRSIIVKNS